MSVTFLNLRTNESVDIATYGHDKNVLIPALFLYWAKDKCAVTSDGLAVQGLLNSEPVKEFVIREARIAPELLGPVRERPPVINGRRVFAIKDARVCE